VLLGGGVEFVFVSGLVVDGLLADGGVAVESGFVVEFGTLFGVADGEFGAALGMFGAASGAGLGVLGVTSGVAPDSVGIVEELGLFVAGGLLVLGIVFCGLVGLCAFCEPMVLCELGLLD
jgi:hypothetical protein